MEAVAVDRTVQVTILLVVEGVEGVLVNILNPDSLIMLNTSQE